MGVDFVRYPTEKQAGDALYNELRRYLGEGPEYHAAEDSAEIAGRTAASPFVVMLAGGSTPMEVYRRLAQEPPRRIHPAAHLMLSDDRYVQLDDDRSNYHHIRPLAEALHLPPERLVHVDTTRPLGEAVSSFGDRIRGLAQRDAIFALAILGIGGDGHTASLFSPTMVPDPVGTRGGVAAPDPVGARGGDRATPSNTAGSGTLDPSSAREIAVHTGVHGGVDRVSVSAEVLLSFRKVVFFATGHAKRDILYELSRRPEQFPAGRILLHHPNATIWTDEAPRVI